VIQKNELNFHPFTKTYPFSDISPCYSTISNEDLARKLVAGILFCCNIPIFANNQP